MVYRCIDALVSCGASKHDIAVLTPYQAQAQLLSRVLHPVVGLVATIHFVAVWDYQGRQNTPSIPVVLFACCAHPTQEGESNARGIHKRSNRLSFVQPVRLLVWRRHSSLCWLLPS